MSSLAETSVLANRRPDANADTLPGSRENPQLLDLNLIKRLLAWLEAPPRIDLAQNVRAARAAGMTRWRLLRDVFWVGRGPGCPTEHEYYYYRLYDPTLPREAARRYIGKRVQHELHNKCNDPRWFAVTHDKALFYAAMSGAGLPVPRTQAVYLPGWRDFAATVIRRPEELATFLRDPTRYPLFIKPIDGIYSLGALSLAAVEGEWIRFTTGDVARVDHVVRFVDGFGGEGFKPVGKGYLLQQRLERTPLCASRSAARWPLSASSCCFHPRGRRSRVQWSRFLSHAIPAIIIGARATCSARWMKPE
jgi:hypothetical protein